MKQVRGLLLPARIIISVHLLVCMLSCGQLFASPQVKPGDFTFDVIPETFELNLYYGGIPEKAGNPLAPMRVANLKKTTDLVSWLYPDLLVSVSIVKKENYLDINIRSEGAGKFVWPRVHAESYMLPLWEGKYIPAKDNYWKSFLKNQSLDYPGSFSMGFFALNKAKYSIVYVLKNVFNSDLHFDVSPDISFSFSHQFPSINPDKTYGFRIYVTPTDPLAVSTVYKNYIREKNRFETLEEKAAKNPNVRKLYGAPHIYFWPHGLISEKNIHWKQLQASSPAKEKFFSWLIQSLKDNEENDAANAFSQVWVECKKQTPINDYQKRIILEALNKALRTKELYNPDVFGPLPGTAPANHLSEQQLYVRNKLLLKKGLGEIIDNPVDWGKESVSLMHDMYQSGIKKAWIGLSDWADGLKNPLLVEEANKLGYLIGPYDSYHSIHQKEDREWRTCWFPDSSLYDNASVTNASGKKTGGFIGVGRQLNPTLAFPSVKQRVAAILSDSIPYNSWFVDCDATGEVFDDYSPDHITTKEEDFKARLQRMEYIGNEVAMVVGSEGGNDFAGKSLAFAQGLEMPVLFWGDPDLRQNKNSPYYVGSYWGQAGKIPSIYTKVIPIKELYEKIYVDPAYSLPLFRLVYNDAVITTAHWENGSLKLKDEVGTRMLSEILYNTPPLYHIDQAEWKLNKTQIIRHIKVWSPLHEKAVTLPMSAFNILSDDRQVQQTVFGNKIKVTVNFSHQDALSGTDLIRARSAVIDDGFKKVNYTVK
ncbi:Glycosyl hydrolases related to GH101 family, GHL1-GHL3 [Chitinophaga ginsengisegetis]|uniref:Glycosyl hydrolases related to GH101 family, GHL1-GHL3 n=1 Tax=Chitinophaga ginsengisegetis TaxID=393003 RepID=A0A1T5PBH6_9BACT|nr:glycoside hydrolase [Chitinophaga ginsengisegetis]SKD09738.1 Glycosyl hydrolases related to GH101 family, GHL1-GHL3 [Chitinophaga ginsengisegetis]